MPIGSALSGDVEMSYPFDTSGERKWIEAEHALSKAIELDPSMANAHNGLGVAYAQQGDFDRAIGEWQQALKLRPDLQDARDNIRRAQEIKKGRPD